MREIGYVEWSVLKEKEERLDNAIARIENRLLAVEKILKNPRNRGEKDIIKRAILKARRDDFEGILELLKGETE